MKSRKNVKPCTFDLFIQLLFYCRSFDWAASAILCRPIPASTRSGAVTRPPWCGPVRAPAIFISRCSHVLRTIGRPTAAAADK